MTVAADLDQAREWLTHLHGESPGLINVCATGAWAGRCFATDPAGVTAAVAYIDWLDQQGREGIYARVTTLSRTPATGKRGGADMSLALPGMWADLDIAGPGHKHKLCPSDCGKTHTHITRPLPPTEGDARRIMAEAGLPEPTLWIHSGGGLYPWHLLDRPIQITADTLVDLADMSARWQHTIEAAANRLGYHYGTGVGNLDRVLRIPGTLNRKEGLERPCRVLNSTGATYRLRDLAHLLYQIDLPEPQPAAAPKPRTASTPPRPKPRIARPAGAATAGTVGPFDALDEVCEWRDLLEPCGYTHAGTERDGAELWRRDGATSAYSIRCGHGGIPVAVVFSDATGLPTGPGNRLTHARLFAHLHHHGDEQEAARDLIAAAAGNPLASLEARALPARILDHIRDRCGITPWKPSETWRDVPWPADHAKPDARPEHRTQHNHDDHGGGEDGMQAGEAAAEPGTTGTGDVRHVMANAADADIQRGVYASRDLLNAAPWTAPGQDSAHVVLPPFPVGCLPGDIGKFAEAVAVFMQVPVDLPCFAILGALAALVGNHATITGKWTENALNLFLAAIADSGEGKSPAVGAVAAPVYDLERHLRSDWGNNHGDAAEAHDIAVKTRDRLVAKIADAHGGQRTNLLADLDSIKQEIADTTPPPKPQLLAGDVTPEVLGKIMHRTGGHIGIISAEGGFLGTLSGRYSRGIPNLELVLTSYDSSEPYRLERITRDPFEVDRPSLTISLAVQPVVVADALSSPAVADRGLLNRFLFAAPESLAGRRDKNPPDVPPHLARAWREAVFRVYHAVLPDGTAFDEHGQPREPVAMRISDDAEALHLGWRIEMESRVDPDSGDLAHIKGWAKKLEGITYRLAALLHLADGRAPQQVVDRTVMEHALTIADWSIEHAQAVLSGGAAGMVPGGDGMLGRVSEAAGHVLTWMRRKAVAEFTVEQVRQALRRRPWVCKHGANGVRAALTELARHGWVASVERRDGRGRRLPDGLFVAHSAVSELRDATSL
ncbi:YfjI family protein [Nonomuraea basaltis]|uniref:YfjI family protein n=1 Tax=Nonomuraea basaltis TaxID=2495887 RepID=UPI00110C691F|nr:YfjI family protein [Nonomuraea basaltis]TMR97569.1 DUF3987 domain-containing protein [Nonomuraea basaltis]